MTETKRAVEPIRVQEFHTAEGTGDWPTVGSDGATAFFPTSSLADAARFVQALAAIEGVEDEPPGIEIRPDGVTVHLISFTAEWGGLTSRHVELARAISATARDLGLSANAAAVQSVGPIVIGANDIGRIRPFWQALLGYVPRPDSPEEDLVDPHGRGPGIWFERVDGGRAERNRMHVAVWVPYDQAQPRVDAAVAAGGTLIFDEYAPAWWTLTDPEGNEADVATTMRRD